MTVNTLVLTDIMTALTSLTLSFHLEKYWDESCSFE